MLTSRLHPALATNPNDMSLIHYALTPTETLSLSPTETWTPLPHGGHSFLFHLQIGTQPGVLKIVRSPPPRTQPAANLCQFRFNHEPRPHDPYLYFHREAAAYTRLRAYGVTTAPRFHQFLAISPEIEAALLPVFRKRGFLPQRGRRKRTGPMPLAAVWMEEVSGVRLGRGMRVEVLEGLEEVHAAGVLHGDVKWRNILVEECGVVRWVDYSNAVCREQVVEGEWEGLVRAERVMLRKMLRMEEKGNAEVNGEDVEADEGAVGVVEEDAADYSVDAK